MPERQQKKKISFLSSKCFHAVKHLPCWPEHSSGESLAQARDAPELSDSTLQIGDAKEPCSARSSCEISVSLTTSVCSENHPKRLKDRPDWGDKHTENERHKLLCDITLGNACAEGKHL